MFRALTVIAFILATVSGQGNFPSPSPVACIDPATGKPCLPSPSPCLNGPTGCGGADASPFPSPCSYGGCQTNNTRPPPPSITPGYCSQGVAGCPAATRSNSPSPSYSPTSSATPSSEPSQQSDYSPAQSRDPLPSSSPRPDPSKPLESSSHRPEPSQPLESSSHRPKPSETPKPTRSPAKPPIYSTVTFPNVDPRRITNQTIRGIQGNISCALGINPEQVILQNATYTDKTGIKYDIPFDASLVNQKAVLCTSPILPSPAHLLRQLQTSSTTFVIEYLILNPALNITDLVTLLSSSPLMTTTLQSLSAVPASSTVAEGGNNNLSLAVGIPLGAIAVVAVVAVVAQVTLRNRRQILSPNQRPIKTVLYVTESPLSDSKEVTIRLENDERISHNPTRIRV